MKIGVVVNPIAGLGGAVGLKGTDGADTVVEAIRRGALPQAGNRVRRAFKRLASVRPDAQLVIAPGQLGTDHLADFGFHLKELTLESASGTALDTRCAVEAMGPVDLIVFAGGDGTVRDVAAVRPESAALLGIPCGVKMHSGVFALSPEAAGNLLVDIVEHPERIEWADDAEIMDIDETALRAGMISPRLYGYARVPRERRWMQVAKGASKRDDSGQLRAAAAEIASMMEPGTLYVIGPGTSTALVSVALGHQPTILGVDAVLDGRQILRDATAAALEELIHDRPVRIIISVTGRQGFLLGRGNQQISPSVIAKAGPQGLIVLASESKLSELESPMLTVDTGLADLDVALSGFSRVQTGPGRFMQMYLRGG